MLRALGFFAILSIALLAWLTLGADDETALQTVETEPSYSFSADPGQEILSIRYWGGMTGEEHKYTLWGDGRLERTLRGRGSAPEVLQKEASLDFDEMSELVGVAVHGSLMEWDEEELSLRIHRALTGDLELEKGGRLFTPTDMPWTEVTLNLETYQASAGQTQSPALQTFSYRWSPRLFRKAFKEGFEVPEIEALIALENFLRTRLPQEKRQ